MTILIYIDYDYIHLHLLEKCIKEFIKWTQTKKNNIIIIYTTDTILLFVEKNGYKTKRSK
jgi:hypothetical protein